MNKSPKDRQARVRAEAKAKGVVQRLYWLTEDEHLDFLALALQCGAGVTNARKEIVQPGQTRLGKKLQAALKSKKGKVTRPDGVDDLPGLALEEEINRGHQV